MKAIDEFLEKHKTDFPELQKFIFSTTEWDAWKASQKFLKVSLSLPPEKLFSLPFGVPHTFQQQLLYKKTPMLCDAIPSFEAMSAKWEEYKYNNPTMANIVQPDLDKLDTYNGMC